MIKVGINGFGRIGRLALRIILEKYSDQIEVPIVNTSGRMDAKGSAHIFEFDTTYRRFPHHITTDGDYMVVDDKKIFMSAQREPEKIPWQDYGVDTVIESTGVFRTEEDLQKHLRDSVRRVILSAPAKGGDVQTVVLGLNDQAAEGKQLLSNASCTTNCVAPVTKIILDNFGIKKAAMTTIHAYTGDQELQDGSHKDLRRARAAAQNLVPTSTGAAIATTKVIPEIEGRFDGIAVRVPIITGSFTDLTYITDRPVTPEEVNEAYKKAAQSEQYSRYIGVTEKPIVSSDVIGFEGSTLVDLSLTKVIDGDLLKVFAWYDNEWGYSCRLVEQILK